MRLLTPRSWQSFLVGLLAVGGTSSAVLFPQAPLAAFHGDEPGWVASGYYYTNLLLARDFTWDKWKGSHLGPWGRLNPHLGKWMIGLPLKLGAPGAPEFAGRYPFSRSHEENVAEGRVPCNAILHRARRVCAAYGVLCCLLVFTLGYVAANLGTGLVAAGLLVTNPLFVHSVTRVLTDGPYCLFLLCCCLAAMFLATAQDRRALLRWCAVLGFCAGLACSVKITGLVIGTLFFLVVLLYRRLTDPIARRVVGGGTLAFAAAALGIVYLLNPVFWPSFGPATGAIWRSAPAVPVETSGFDTQTFPEWLPQHPNLGRVLELPMLFLRWRAFMRGQSERHGAGWGPNRLRTLTGMLRWHSAHSLPIQAFLAIGLWAGLRSLRISLRRRRINPASMPLVAFMVHYLFLLAFLPLNWGRYYLPTVIASQLLSAGGICVVLQGVCRWLATTAPAGTMPARGRNGIARP